MTEDPQPAAGGTLRAPEPWTEADREIAHRPAEGPFLGARAPDRHADRIRQGLEQARRAGVFLDAPCFMAVTRGPDHVIVNVTPTVYRIVGPRRLLGSSIREAIPELADGPNLDLVDRAVEAGHPYETGLESVRLYRDPGEPDAGFEERWISFAYHPLPGEGDARDGLLITGVDVTDKIRARRTLERRVRQQEAVARLGAHALARPGLRHLAPEVVRCVSGILDARAAALLEIQRESGGPPADLRIRARVGPGDAPDRVPADGSPEARVLASGEAVRIRDATGSDLAGHLLVGNGRSASALLVPVSDPDDTPRAVLAAYSPEPDRFDEADLHFLEGLANTLAAAWRRQEGDRFRATLLRNLPGVVYRCRHDRDWTMEFLSTGVRELTGYASEELLGNRVISWADLIHPEDRDGVWREVSRAVAEGVPFELRYRIRRRDGDTRWVCEQGRAVERIDRPPVLEGYIFDVTESRSAREELRETRSLLETTFQSIREAVLVVDASDRTILECNPAVTEITGYGREELLGRSTRLLHVDRESYREFGRKSERALEEEGVFRGEFQLRRKDGCVIPTEHLVSYLEADHPDADPPAAVSVVRDLSERKRREEEIRASRRRLQSLSRDLLRVREEERARISRHLHDVVGQTLTAVKFGLDALEGEVGSDEASERLDRVRGLVGDSLQEIRDLSVELRPAVLDDLGLLPAIRWYLDRLRERVDFEIDLAVGPELPDGRLSRSVQTQAFRITQEALLNVARHADATRAEVEVRAEAGEVAIVVRDDGRGFERARHAPLRPGGRHLGLVGMEERASLADGALQVDSSPGEGTVIRFRAPLQPADRV